MRLALLLGVLASGRAALAQTIDVKVLLDLDNSASIGCTVATPAGAFAGADEVLLTTVDVSTHTVTSLQHQVCLSGILGAPTPVAGPFSPPWQVGPGNGAFGSTLIETYFPLSPGQTTAESVRVAFIVSDAGGDEDALLPSTLIPTDGTATRIPTLSAWGVVLLSAVLAFAGFAMLRRRRGGAVALLGVILLLTGLSGVAWAAMSLDGQDSDWAGINPLATKSPSLSPSHPELLAVYGVEQAGTFFFRADALLTSAPAITSADHATFTIGTAGSFTVTTTGLPAPALSETGALPAGVTFVDNGDGTATIAGTPGGPSGTSTLTIKAANGVLPDALQTFTLTVVCQTITVTNPTSNSDPAGTALPAANFTFTQTGAVGGATFTTSSTLPTGVSLTTSGTLTGTPTQGGSFPILVTVTDGNGCTGTNPSYTLTIICPTITVTNPANTQGTAGVAFSEQFTQSGGVGTITFSETGALPTGFTFNTSTGVLSGTTNQVGAFPIMVTATDANGCQGTGAQYNLTINCQTINVTNPGVNTGTVDAAFSQTFTVTGILGTVSWSETGALPAGITLDSSTGVLSGTPTVNGSFPITVKATDTNGCFGTSSYTLTINCQTITVTNPVTNTGTVDAPFSQTFTQSGAHGGATFTTASTLPAGLTLSTAGVLSGTPTVPGTFPIVVTVTDSNGCTGTGATYTLTIGCQTITVTNPANTTGTVNAPFSEQFTQGGAHGSTTFSTASTLPSGLTLSSSGLLSGTPTVPGSFPIVVTVTDSNGCTGTGATYNLTIACQTITVTNPATTTGTVNAAFSEQFTQAGALGGATFSTASTLPSGLTLHASGVLDGTPTQPGTFPIVVTVTDGNGCTGTGPTYTLVIACQAITLGPAALPQGTSGSTYPDVSFTQTGGIGAVTFATASTLPTGMTLASNGTLSGTPGQTGSFPITVTATDANGCTGSRGYLLVIACSGTAITLSPGSLPTAPVSVPYSATLSATGGNGTYAFSEAGALPATMTFTDNGDGTATLAGTPGTTGVYPITVSVTDGNTCAGSQDYLFVVTCGGTTVTVDPGSLSPGTVATAYAQTFTVTGTGTAPYSFAEAGALPTGMSFTDNGNNTASLTGTPTQTGTFAITVSATDGNGCTGATGYSLVIACQTITVTNPVNATGTAGSLFSEQFTQLGGQGTITWSETGALPSGITLNTSTGVLSGTTSQVGSFPITVTATDQNGCQGTGATYTLVITCPTITVSGAIPALTYNTAMATATFTQGGGNGTITWSATGLPTGVGINSGTGAVTGTPSVTGTFAATITATDASGCTGTKSQTVTVAPVAAGDSYSGLVDNTQLVITGGTTASPATPFVAATGKLITNDLPSGGVAATAGTVSTFAGGSVTIAADGTFIYTPKANPSPGTAITADSFSYTVVSNTGGGAAVTSAPASVSLTLSGRVWYVKNDAGGGGNGQSQSPFNTLAAAGAASVANDIIFVYTGDGTTTNQDAGITLKSGQQLIGNGVALVVNAHTLVAAGTKPQITNTTAASDVVTLDDGNTVKGLTISGATRDGIAGNTHAGFTADTLTVQTNTNVGVDLISMTGTVTITNSTISTVGNQALTINNGTAAVTVDNTNTLAGGSGTAVAVLNRPLSAGAIAIGATLTGGRIQILSNLSGTISFTGSQTLSNTSVDGVALSTNAGATIGFSGTLNVTTTTGVPFQASGGGTLNVTGTANLTSGAAATGLSLNGMTVGGSGVTFTSVSTTGATTGVNLVNDSGTVAVNGGTIGNGTTGISLQGASTSLSLAGVTITGPTTGITNTTNFGTLTIGGSVSVSAITALNLTTGAVSGTFANVSSSGGTNGVNLNAVTGSWGTSAGTLTGASGSTFNVSGGSGGTISWGGTINQANAANVVTIAGSNSNTINFSGNVTSSGTSTGISIGGNSGTYNFTGGASTITGTGGGVTIANESGTISFGSGYSINGPTTSFKIGGSATNVSANITYSGTITNTVNGGVLLDVNSASGTFNGTLTMNGASLSGNVAGSAGVISVIKNMIGTLTVNNLSLTSSNISFTNTLVAISGTNTAGSFTFNHLTLSATGSGHAGKGLTMTGGGTLAITGAGGASSIDVSSTALDLNGIALGASTVGTVSSSGGTNGITLTSVTGGTFTISAGTLTGSSTGSTFNVSGGTATFTYNGSMSQSNAQRIVNVSGITGGTITLGGAITGSTSCTGINLGGSGGTVTISGGISLNGASDTFSATTAGLTINVTGSSNDIGATTAPTGPAVNIASTTIGASGVTFHSVSATGGASGIILNNTGSTGSFTITGAGSSAVGGDNSGGTIQNSTSHGIALTQTLSPSFTNIHVTNTSGSGIKGVNAASGGAQVTNFTLHNSTIDNSGTGGGVDESNVGFNQAPSANETNLTGTVSITQNSLLTAGYHGFDLQQFGGPISSIDVSNNTFTSATASASSHGSGIRISVRGTASASSSISAGTFNSNSITNFPNGGGIIVQGGNGTSVSAPSTTLGPVQIHANTIAGQAGTRMGTQGVNMSIDGHGTSTFEISNNDVSEVQGVGVTFGAFGAVSATGTMDGNSVNSNSNVNGQPGISAGVDQHFAITDTPSLIITSMNLNVTSNTQGNGILLLARSSNGTLKANVTNSNVAAPLGGVRPGIRVDSGNATAGENTTVCVNLTGNTSAGSGGTNGIGLRKQGTVPTTDAFGVVGMAATATPGVEAYVSGLNPAGGGVLLISATSGFSSCTIP